MWPTTCLCISECTCKNEQDDELIFWRELNWHHGVFILWHGWEYLNSRQTKSYSVDFKVYCKHAIHRYVLSLATRIYLYHAAICASEAVLSIYLWWCNWFTLVHPHSFMIQLRLVNILKFLCDLWSGWHDWAVWTEFFCFIKKISMQPRLGEDSAKVVSWVF